MKKAITVTAVPEPKLSKNARRSLNHNVEAKLIKGSREEAFVLSRNELMKIDGKWKELEKCKLKAKYFYSNIPPDYDGLAAMIAPIVDGMVDAGIMKDDNPNVILDYSLEVTKVPHRHMRRVEITVSKV
tara:strand:+ start:6795 stop:7181 length:387 start_codon:yes stop_codon:yes gene_type:complete